MQSSFAGRPSYSMTPVRDLVAGPITTGKDFKEVQETVVAAYGDQALKKNVIYDFMRRVNAGKSTANWRQFKPKEIVRKPALITPISTAIAEEAISGPCRCLWGVI